METLYPKIECPLAAEDSLDPLSLFDGVPRQIWMEIGFGGGEHLVGQADRHRDVGMIGVESFLEGVGKALSLVDEKGLDNVRLHEGDGRMVLAGLKPASLDRLFILFADPWPKLKHHKRRIVQDETVAIFADKLKPGGGLRFATDVSHYADWALERFLRAPQFDWTAKTASDWRMPPDDHITTRYQTKNKGDCAPVFLDFVRV